MSTTRRPLFKDLSDSALRDAYWATRGLLANAGNMRAARQVFALTRDLDIIVAVARKRGLSLV